MYIYIYIKENKLENRTSKNWLETQKRTDIRNDTSHRAESVGDLDRTSGSFLPQSRETRLC